MPIYQLDETLAFPDPALANKDGLLAVGGDLSPERLLLAYSLGIFPWFHEGTPILWWSPPQRMVLFPDDFKVSKSLRQTLRSGKFEVSFDKNLPNVIEHCARIPREGQDGTWITEDMKEAYIRLHQLGFAHSVETYLEGKLAGGLYGVSLGRAFFGESMFFLEKDASKVALYYLVERMKNWKFQLIDAQQKTRHLKSLGASTISREGFIKLLEAAMKEKTIRGNWDSINFGA